MNARLSFLPLFLACALLAAAAPPAPAAADTLITVESRQTATVDGEEQPERKHTAQIWIGDNAIARDDGETRTVFSGDELLLIGHRDRKFNRLKLPVDPLELAPPEMRDQMKDRLAAAKLSGKLEASDETQQVGDWTAKRYDLALQSEMGMSVDMVIWAAPDVGASAARYLDLTRTLASMQLGGDEWVALLDQVDGFPVLRETTMSNERLEVVSTERVLSVEEAKAPEGMYGPPVGYTEAEMPVAGEAPAAAAEDEGAMEEDGAAMEDGAPTEEGDGAMEDGAGEMEETEGSDGQG